MSLTWSASEIRKAVRLWEEQNDARNPFAHILVSPLFADPSTIKAVYEMKERLNSKIYFDSGGYYVQQGRISYPTLRDRLYEYYMKPDNQWADYYVLPDHVPTSTDSDQVVQNKVNETCTVARQFFQQIPSSLQERALPVIQGHTAQQIYTCVDTYTRLGTPQVGFGSFGTSGATNGINMMTDVSYQMLSHVRDLARERNLSIHLFGVGTPPLLYFFQKMGIASFDNMAWVRSAGFGNAFLPFMKGFMVSQTPQAMMRSSLDREAFERLKLITDHRCPFCENFFELSSNRWHRIMHNLVCILDTLEFIQSWSQKRILETIQEVSPRYLRYYREWIAV
jgi:queuine/archaeosine tRNA-ribosyltransferase